MFLKDYLTIHKLPQTEMARKTGISKQAICNYLIGKRRPGYAQALAIQKATGGKVSVDEQMEYYELNKKEKTSKNNAA